MEPEPHQPPLRFYEIDLLRLLAALAVVFYHYTYRGYMANNYSPVAFPALAPVTKYGYLGVELFFIISGYVVLRSAQGKTVRSSSARGLRGCTRPFGWRARSRFPSNCSGERGAAGCRPCCTPPCRSTSII